MSNTYLKLLSALLIGLLLAGCEGDDGRVGDAGTPGVQGPPGNDGEDGEDGEDGADAPNQNPLVSAIEDQNIVANVTADPIGFLVFDDRTNADQLTIAVASDNQGLIADSGIQVQGTFVTRALVITPVASQIGSANITISVTDGDGASSQSAFTVIVGQQVVSTVDFVTQVFNDDANATPRDLNSRLLIEDAEDVDLYNQLVP